MSFPFVLLAGLDSPSPSHGFDCVLNHLRYAQANWISGRSSILNSTCLRQSFFYLQMSKVLGNCYCLKFHFYLKPFVWKSKYQNIHLFTFVMAFTNIFISHHQHFIIHSCVNRSLNLRSRVMYVTCSNDIQSKMILVGADIWKQVPILRSKIKKVIKSIHGSKVECCTVRDTMSPSTFECKYLKCLIADNEMEYSLDDILIHKWESFTVSHSEMFTLKL